MKNKYIPAILTGTLIICQPILQAKHGFWRGFGIGIPAGIIGGKIMEGPRHTCTHYESPRTRYVEVKRVSSCCTSLRQEIKDLESENQSLIKENNQLEQECNRLRKKLELQCIEHENGKMEQRRERKKYKQIIQSLEKKLENLQKSVSEIETKIKTA
jgi:predicted RNase H-like nuclease (RuvC/YqgF family)